MRRRTFLWGSLIPALRCDAVDPAENERRTFTAINRARGIGRVPPLAWNEALARQARQHCARMRDLRFFAHDDPQWGDVARRLRRAGIPWVACAENIFQEQGYPDPVKAAMEGWLTSPGHRRNLLDPKFTLTGIGVTIGPGATYYFTQIFSRR